MKNALLCALVRLIALFCVAGASAEGASWDVVVVGAGMSGCAAAIQAARMGVSVALVESTEWAGGQSTAAAVSTLDDMGRTRTGIYGEFIECVHREYARLGRNTNICLWGGDTIAFEPAVGRRIWMDLLREAGKVDCFFGYEIENATLVPQAGKNDKKRLVSVRARSVHGTRDFSGKIFIDATECGDLIPLAGARYRAGNGVSPRIDPEAAIQDITYVAVVRKFPPGASPLVAAETASDDAWMESFRAVVAKGGSTWPGQAPYDFASHNAYRAMPDPESPISPDIVQGDEPETWSAITKTAINWANDFRGVTARYLEDRAHRASVDRAAMRKTAAFIRYMQTALGEARWSVDESQGFANARIGADDPNARLFAHFPPIPYVRESRRLVGLRTLAARDIRRDPVLGRALKNFKDAVSLGEYQIDIHGSHADGDLEADLGEHASDFPKVWVGSEGVFQVPMACLIPESTDGLLAAEKNISVSRMVAGASRLHPVVTHTGQAAGALAATCARGGIDPRSCDARIVQDALVRAGQALSMRSFEDVPADKKTLLWANAQLAVLHEVLPPLGRTIWGADFPIRRREAEALVAWLFEKLPAGETKGNDAKYVNREAFGQIMARIGAPAGNFFAFSAFPTSHDLSVTRGEALRACMDRWRFLSGLSGREENFPLEDH